MTTELTTRIERFLDSIPTLLDGVEGRIARAKAYQAALSDAGLAGLDVATEYGGAGEGASARATFDAVTRGRLPKEADLFTIGLGMGIPTILKHGSPALRERYVAPALRGEEIWCQMYSEPGAGSDLAGLQTRAERTDDGWILTGQKVWTSVARDAQFAICLARTDIDLPKHKGITMFVLPMDQPGVTVRPIVQITGDDEFNEVFLDRAVVPLDHVVGEVNGGWKVAVSLLQEERQAIGSGKGRQPVPITALIELVAGDDELRSDPAVAAKLADCFIGQRLASLFDVYQAELRDSGKPLGPLTSLGKLWRSTNGRLASDLVSQVAFTGRTAWPTGDEQGERWTYALLDACALSLGGGTDEVQKNGLAEQVLRLPRDPFQTDHLPFRELRTGAGES